MTDSAASAPQPRHSLVLRVIECGVGLVQAQRILGHSTPALTAQIYTHLEVEDLRSAIDALPELGETTTDERQAKEAR